MELQQERQAVVVIIMDDEQLTPGCRLSFLPHHSDSLIKINQLSTQQYLVSSIFFQNLGKNIITKEKKVPIRPRTYLVLMGNGHKRLPGTGT